MFFSAKRNKVFQVIHHPGKKNGSFRINVQPKTLVFKGVNESSSIFIRLEMQFLFCHQKKTDFILALRDIVAIMKI